MKDPSRSERDMHGRAPREGKLGDRDGFLIGSRLSDCATRRNDRGPKLRGAWAWESGRYVEPMKPLFREQAGGRRQLSDIPQIGSQH
jgi:hypothetical protein